MSGIRRPSPDTIAASVVFLIAFAARLLPVFVFPGINYPDEIFESLEQAHRLVYGYGFAPWEFIIGTRSWVFPGAIAGLMTLAARFGDGPSYYIPMIGCALAALGASSALCAFLWVKRLYGTAGGFIAGITTAVWIDAVYFGPRTLNESVAAHVFVIGLYASMPQIPGIVTWRRAALAGALLMLAGSLRVQLLPAIAVIGLWVAYASFRRQWVAFVAGGFLSGLLYGMVDSFTWGYPFEALWRNVLANLYYDVQKDFGVSPWYWYLSTLIDYWAGLAPIMLALCIIGAVRLPQLFVAAAIIALTHSLIGHKEFRFIYPAILLVTIVSGAGLARLAAWVVDTRRTMAAYPIIAYAAALSAVILAQVNFGLRSAPYRELWTHGRDNLLASQFVSGLDSVCGIGLIGFSLGRTGGYAYFHHAVPIYWTSPANPFNLEPNAFNTIVYARPERIDSAYVERACFGNTCVAQRRGFCSSVPMPKALFPRSIPERWKTEAGCPSNLRVC